MNRKYWVIINSEEKGAYDFKQLFKIPELNENTLIWYRGLEKWTELKNLDIYNSYVSLKEKERKQQEDIMILKKKRKKYLIFFSVILLIFMCIFIYLFSRYNTSEYLSEDLKANNLRGRVKAIISNDMGLATLNNLELYDYNGNLLLYSNAAFSVSMGLNTPSRISVTLNHYLISKTKLDSVSNDFYSYNFQIFSTYKPQLNRIDIRNGNNVDEIDNINEEHFLDMVLINNENKKIKQFFVDEANKILLYPNYCFQYNENESIKMDCNTNEIIEKNYYKNGKIHEKIEYSTNNKYYQTITAYNAEEKKIKKEIFDKDKNKWCFVNYLYNSEGRLLKEKTFIDRTESKYNDDIMFSLEESTIWYEYMYDSKGNWTKLVLYKNGVGEIGRFHRNIEYYSFFDFLKNLIFKTTPSISGLGKTPKNIGITQKKNEYSNKNKPIEVTQMVGNKKVMEKIKDDNLDKTKKEYGFTDFPANVIMVEKAPIKYSSNKLGNEYKTVITEGYQNKTVNFAGHYILILWGAGTGQSLGVIVNVKDGKIYNLPLTGENSYRGIYHDDNNNILYKSNSNLFICYSSTNNEKDKNKVDLEYFFYEFKDSSKEFNLITQMKKTVDRID